MTRVLSTSTGIQQQRCVASCGLGGSSLDTLLQSSGDNEGVGTSGVAAYYGEPCSDCDSGEVDNDEKSPKQEKRGG